MKLDVSKLGSVTVLTPRGPLTQGDAEDFAGSAEETRVRTNGRLVLDLAQVPYLDSRGVEVLMDLADRQLDGGQTMRVAACPELCREILELTGVAGMLDLFDTPESAVRSFL